MIERFYIPDGQSGQIHYAVAGRGPTILCLHQTPRSWDEFREVMEYLQDDFQIIAMDLPGMGASSAPLKTASSETYARASIDLIKSVVSGALIVCVHHTGGAVAHECAAREHELFDGLILSSTPWVDAAEREARRSKTPIDTISRTRQGDHLLDLWQQRSDYYPAGPEFLDRFLADALAATSPTEGHLAVGRYEMEASTPQIKCPVLIVEHSLDPFASKHTGRLQNAFPEASVSRIPEGRVPLAATARQFADLVRTWAHKQFQTLTKPEGVS